MGQTDTMNSLNNGKGLRALTTFGVQERAKRVRDEKKRRRIHHTVDCSGESWYQDIERVLFAPDHQGRYWDYAQVVPA